MMILNSGRTIILATGSGNGHGGGDPKMLIAGLLLVGILFLLISAVLFRDSDPFGWGERRRKKMHDEKTKKLRIAVYGNPCDRCGLTRTKIFGTNPPTDIMCKCDSFK